MARPWRVNPGNLHGRHEPEPSSEIRFRSGITRLPDGGTPALVTVILGFAVIGFFPDVSTLAFLVILSGQGITLATVAWLVFVSVTTADAEGLTISSFRTRNLSWPEVQELRLEPGASNVIAYDASGHRLRLRHTHAPALAALRKLWRAGRGETWVRTAEIPEVGKFEPTRPPRLSFGTGMLLAFTYAGATMAIGVFMLAITSDEIGLFASETPGRREIVLVLLAFFGAPAVAFTVTLTLERKKRRDELRRRR